MIIPSKKECIEILKQNKTPSNVIGHSKAVCRFAENLATKLEKKGIKINKELVIAGSLLHDIQKIEEDHVVAGAKLINELGFPEVANVARKHGLTYIGEEKHHPITIEEKIVFYADKRVRGNKVVSLKERFDDINSRYNKETKEEFEFSKKVEKELNQ